MFAICSNTNSPRSLPHFVAPDAEGYAFRGYCVQLFVNPEDTWLGSNRYGTFVTASFVERIFVGFDLIRAFPAPHLPNNVYFMGTHDILIFRRADF